MPAEGDERDSNDPVQWFDWGEETFARAHELERPAFLFLKAAWCRFSKRMERGVLFDPAIAELLNERFIPIKVDKDRRPEVNDRYNMGGWPSLCVLTSDGELITGGTTFTVDELRDVLERVARYYATRREVFTTAIQDMLAREEKEDRLRASRLGELSDTIVNNVEEAIIADFDTEHAGFGDGQKFPHPEAIDYALLRFVETGDPKLGEVVDRTLSGMAESPLHDHEEGGFFRYSSSRDWRTPHTEKLLESNVGLLRNYLEAFQTFDRPLFRRVSERIVEFLREVLRNQDLRAFSGSQDSDDAYYAKSLSDRQKIAAPEIDRTVYVNWNAAAVSALLKAAAVLESAECARMAEDTLNFLLEECYDPGRGMYHYHDGSPHILGLLTDQAYMARALLHATQFTGQRRYLEVAEDLLQILASKQGGDHGGFYDIRVGNDAMGGLRRRNQSILENGLIAEVFLRTYYLTQKEEFLEIAERTLKLFAKDYHLYGYFTAGYARAVDLFLHPPVHAVIVGSREDGNTQAMVRAASGIYLPSKLVQVLDPEHDQDLLTRFELPMAEKPAAFINVRTAHLASVDSPEELARVMRAQRKG